MIAHTVKVYRAPDGTLQVDLDTHGQSTDCAMAAAASWFRSVLEVGLRRLPAALRVNGVDVGPVQTFVGVAAVKGVRPMAALPGMPPAPRDIRGS